VQGVEKLGIAFYCAEREREERWLRRCRISEAGGH
jgi:hypothetical protein